MKKTSNKQNRGAVILVVVITAFITTFTGSALNLSIPDISKEFTLTASVSGWIITGYTLAVTFCSIPAGRLADIKSKKTVLAAGLVIFTSCCIAAVFCMSGIILIVLRLLQGVGAAMIFSTNTAILTENFPQEERGKVLGYSLAATYAGQSAGPVLGGVLNYNLGWKSIFIFTEFFSAVSLVATIFKLKSKPADKEHFVRSNPFKDNPEFKAASISALLNYSATFAISYLVSVYLQNVLGFNSQTAGFIMISQPIIMMLLSPVAGKLSDKIPPFKLSAIGMILCSAGMAVLIFIDDKSPLWLIIVVLIVTGAGFALFSSPNTNAAMSSVTKDNYGFASSVLATMRAAGHSISMMAVNLVVNIYAAGLSFESIQTDLLIQIINVLFVGFTMVCVAGSVISIRRFH